MKPGRIWSTMQVGLLAGLLAATVALASGCSTLFPARQPAPCASCAASAAQISGDETGTTRLMSAQLLGPAPKVGKAHLASGDEIEAADTTVSDESAPKATRRSDGSRRGGGFGATK